MGGRAIFGSFSGGFKGVFLASVVRARNQNLQNSNLSTELGPSSLQVPSYDPWACPSSVARDGTKF